LCLGPITGKYFSSERGPISTAYIGAEEPSVPIAVFAGNRPECRFTQNVFESTKNRRVVGVITVPHGPGPFPAVVCIHGHDGNRDSPYSAFSAYHGFAQVLADNGFVTISIDVGSHAKPPEGVSLTGVRVWDLIRAVDLVASMPQVDPRRIGCAGLSLGGALSMWLAAMDERIGAAVVAGWMPTIEQLRVGGHCRCWDFPGFEENVDFPDIFGLIAPRPLLVQQGAEDLGFPPSATRPNLLRVGDVYRTFGHGEQLSVVAHKGQHELLADPTLKFFKKVFKVPDKPPPASEEPKAGHEAAPVEPGDTNPPFAVTGAFGLIAVFALGYSAWLRRGLKR
jgi:hypothetical protein